MERSVRQYLVKIADETLRTPIAVVALMILLFVSALSRAQEKTNPPQSPPNDQPQAVKTPPDPTIENTITAVESDESEEATRGFKHWNEFGGKYITTRVGGGFLVDYAAFSQDQQSKEQFSLKPGFKFRDFRFLLSGKFPELKRSVTYSVGIMYDAPSNSWFIRQTGIMAALSEKWGYLFIGRSKEGFSLNKVMTGYDGWTMERAT